MSLETGRRCTNQCRAGHEAEGRTPLHVIGQFSSMFTYNGRTSQHTVFVIKGLRNNLLGFLAITALNMAVRVDTIQTTESKSYHNTIVNSYPSLFHGLGQLGEPYEIKLIPDSTPGRRFVDFGYYSNRFHSV